MVKLTKNDVQKTRNGRIKIEQKLLKAGVLFCLLIFIKLVFREINIVCIGVLSLPVVKTNSLNLLVVSL